MKSVPLTPELYQYLIAQRSNATDPILEELTAETAALGDFSGMQISPEQGSFLTILVAALNVQTAVEIGTFTGTSALCIARGLGQNGKLHCFDKSDEWTQIARNFWQKAGVADKIELHLGDARENLQILEGKTLDFAFIDADKGGYDAYFEAILPLLRPGGVVIFDNMLRNGRVIAPENAEDQALITLNAKLATDSRVESVLLPIADGLNLCRKK